MKWILSISILAVICAIFFWMSGGEDLVTATVNQAYSQAIVSETIYERETRFNKVLALLGGLEKTYNPTLGSGNLYLGIGNAFSELENYPAALYYYHKARELNPADEEIFRSINRTREKLELPQLVRPTVFDRLLFFHTLISLPKRLDLIFLFSIIAFILGSFFVWYEKKWQKSGACFFLAITLILTFSVFYTRYSMPLQGVLMEPTFLTFKAESSKQSVTKEPTPAGVVVDVLDVLDDGKWLKVMAPGGTLGFVPAEKIRIFSVHF